MTRNKRYKISELEEICGVRRSTVHHYVDQGLLHRPLKTGQTMAYYDESHVKRLEAIQKIKLDYLDRSKSSRVPLDYIKHKLSETYSLLKPEAGPRPGEETSGRSNNREKKDAIIEATLRLYAHRGYYLTNIRDIVRAAGISAPTFYRYFRDKRELFVETIEYVVKDFKREIRQAVKSEMDPARRSKIMFEIFHAHYPKMGEILNQLRSGVIIGDPWARESLSRLYREMMENLIKELQGAMRNGLIRQVDPALLAYFNLSINEAAIHLTSMDPAFDMDQAMAFVGDMLNHAYLADHGPIKSGLFYKSEGQD